MSEERSPSVNDRGGIEDDAGVAGCDNGNTDGLASVKDLPGSDIRVSGPGKYRLAVRGAFLRFGKSVTGTNSLKTRLGVWGFNDPE